MQAATILYNDRINTWRRMKQLDEQLDSNPTEAAVREMAELRIRNLQAFDELHAYDTTGRYLFRHPLLAHRSELSQLRDLFRRDPQEFLHQHRLVADYIRRYTTYLKRNDRQDRRQQDRERLTFYQERDQLFQEAMKTEH